MPPEVYKHSGGPDVQRSSPRIAAAASWAALPEVSHRRAASPPPASPRTQLLRLQGPVLRSRSGDAGHSSRSPSPKRDHRSADSLFQLFARVERQALVPPRSLPQVPSAGFRGPARKKSSSTRQTGRVDQFVISGGTVPPTMDRNRELDRPGTAGQLQTGEILVPSGTVGNDLTRIWNSGNRLGCSPLQSSASAPDLQGTAQVAGTPRSMRRLVREASSKTMVVPDRAPVARVRCAASAYLANRKKLPTIPGHYIDPEDKESFSLRPPVGKNIMWQESHEGLDRSIKLLGALFDVRRAGKEPPAEGSAKSKDPLEDAPLFKATLMDLKDTSESLQKTANQIKEGHEPVSECGGQRHPSAVIANRTLLTVQRKLDLVREVETRLFAFEAAHKNKEQLFKQVSEGTGTVPVEMEGTTAFIKKQVHPGGGEPVDADKSDFNSFAKSFGLPAKHKLLQRLDRLANEANDWWTVETLKRAQNGAGADELKRLLAVTTGIGARSVNKRDGEAARAIMGDRLAEAARNTALELKKKDEFAQSRTDVPQVESAQRCADMINESIKEAVKLGAPQKHPALEETKKIALEFEELARTRIALKALLAAQREQLRDENNQKAVGPDGIVKVGLATGLAENVEDAIKKAKKEGAPENHEHMEAAREIAKALREVDGVRKRMAAREARLAEKK